MSGAAQPASGDDLFAAAGSALAASLADDPGFLAYVEQVRQKRREVAAEGLAQIRKAEVLYCNYAAAMKRIGLHPLSWLEIGDRRHELRRMGEAAEETDANEETLAFHYQDRQREAAQSAGSNGR